MLATMIRCGTCGKRYDYNKDELCPRCGAYTSPSDRQQQMLQAERQMLGNRFGAPEDCTPECMPQGYGGHVHRPSAPPPPPPASVRTATRRASRREAAAARFDARREYARETRPTGNRWIKVVFFLLILGVLLLILVPTIVGPILEERSAAYGRVDTFSAFPHALGEPFQTGELSITPLEWGVIDSPELALQLPADHQLVYVRVSIPGVEDLPNTLPQVYLSGNGTYFRPLRYTDQWYLSSDLLQMGYEEIALEDALYLDPAEGCFLFVAEKIASPYVFCVEEMEYNALGWAKVTGVHEVTLDGVAGREAAI